MWLQSTGILRYDPPRPGLKNSKWWCVLETSDELADYYRWFLNRQPGLKPIHAPTWGSHISVVRGEEPADEVKDRWGMWDGSSVGFSYRHYPRLTGDTTGDRPGKFWFLDVKCEALKEVRRNLRLPTYWKFHLTVGRLWHFDS